MVESPSLGGSEGNYSIIVDLIVYQLNYIILHRMIFVCAILYYTVLGHFGKEAAFALWAVLLCRLTGIDMCSYIISIYIYIYIFALDVSSSIVYMINYNTT